MRLPAPVLLLASARIASASFAPSLQYALDPPGLELERWGTKCYKIVQDVHVDLLVWTESFTYAPGKAEAVDKILALCSMRENAVESAITKGTTNLLNSKKQFAKKENRGLPWPTFRGLRAWLTKMPFKRFFGNKYQGNVLSKMNLNDKMTLRLLGFTPPTAGLKNL